MRRLFWFLFSVPFAGSYWRTNTPNVITSGGTRIDLDHLGRVLAARRNRLLYDPQLETAHLVTAPSALHVTTERHTYRDTMRRLVGAKFAA